MASALEKAYWEVTITDAKKNELERQKTFLLGFSHELRNLINSITVSIQLCLLEEISSKVKELLHSSQVCGQLLIHLVNNILDTGKVEIGELEVNPTPNNTYDLFEKIWSVCSQLIHKKKLHGRMRIEKTIPKFVMLDNHRLTQIFLNVIGNAIKYTEQGSISVDISWIADEDQVTERCFHPYPFDDEDEGLFEKAQKLCMLNEEAFIMDAHCHKKIKEKRNSVRPISSQGIIKIVVTDTGCGIATEQIPELFHKFTQVGADIGKRTLGTGLGLFITKQLVHRMKGDIRVFSKVGKGSAFVACLPVTAIQEHNQQVLESSRELCPVELRDLKVMIVDDIDFNRVILNQCFNKIGIEVEESAKDGLEAFEKYKANIRSGKSFDIVTMDVDMPVMNGKKSSELIRNYERLHNLKPCLLAIISGNCSESEIKECLDVRGVIKADLFLKKPTSIDDIGKVVKMRLNKTHREN